MFRKAFFGSVSLVAILLVALCANESFARGGGGGGGGHGGGGGGGFYGGGGGGFHGGGFSGGGMRAGGFSGGGMRAGSFSGGGMRAGGFSGGGMRAGSFGGGEFGRAGTGMGYAGHGLNNGLGVGRYGNGYGNGRWGNYFGRGYGGYGGWGYGGWGLGLGLGLGLADWGYPYDYGYYPDLGDYYYSYAPTNYYVDSGPVVDSGVAAPQQIPPTSTAIAPATPEDQQQAEQAALQYYSEARDAFLQGDYKNALRLAGHAGVEAPRNPKVHELISLALFAQGNYTAAASEAHAAMALGPIAEWKDLYAYYDDVNKYTTQLRALENAVAANPKDAADRFLLGYQYVMIGARDNAKTQFADAVTLTPKDKLADHFLKELQSGTPLTPPQMASRPQGKAM